MYKFNAENNLTFISSLGIIIFTDGVFGTTDAGWSEALLSQLRHNTIACSFVQVIN